MKVLHLGNLCNNSYKLAKFQRQLGVGAFLEIEQTQKGTNDDPAWEDAELKHGFPDWISVRQAGGNRSFAWAGRGIRRLLHEKENISKNYDLVHAQCTAPIMAQFKAPGRLVSHCLGSDIRELAQSNTIAGYLLRRAYHLSRIVFFNNVDHIIYLRKLGIKGSFLPNPLDITRFSPHPGSIDFGGYDFVVLHPTSLDWSYKGAKRSSTKGNDKLIRAFGKFIQHHPKALLLMIVSGPDVAATQELTKELGIERNVKFIDRMRKDILLDMIRSVDLVADQFDLGAMGGTAIEVLACGKPLLTYLREDCARECYGELPPIYNARTEDEIFSSLMNAFEHDLAQIGSRSRTWAERHHNWKIVTKTVLEKYKACAVE